MPNQTSVTWGVLLLTVISCRQGPETNQSDLPARKASIEEIDAGIRQHIQQESEAGNGFFQVKDKKKSLRLKLVRVHTEYLANLGAKSYFACVDLADVSGDVYDVDFFLKGDPGKMTVTETSVHKLNGKPYYAWKQRSDKTWYRVPVKEASARLLGVIEGSDEFDFYYQLQLPEMDKKGKMWIPMAGNDRFQTVALVKLEVPGTHRVIRETEYGNTILYVETGPEDSGQKLEIVYHIKRLEKGAVDDEGEIPSRYLEANAMMPVGGRFAEIAREVIGSNSGKLMQARALYDYIIDNMRYMKYGEFGKGDANSACDLRTGNCSEFHSFFISLARSAGIPARFAVGAAIPSERNDGGIDGYHCWAEFYAEGKWWPVDISEGNKYTPLATYYFGHHPANRIELSRGRDLLVEPMPQSGPINFHAFPLLEVDGKVVETLPTFSFTRVAERKIDNSLLGDSSP